MTQLDYVGSELDLFAAVTNWKDYWSATIRSYITGDVLEVGAGIGSNTRLLVSGDKSRWTCLEPDPHLVDRLQALVCNTASTSNCRVLCGTLADLDSEHRFDTIIYIDVLEHIEKDREELGLATTHLRPGGRIIVLSPAHQALFTAFDAAIGHFRRYNKSMLGRLTPANTHVEKLIYLDAAGLALSAANRVLLRQSMPTPAQLAFWDKCVIPISRTLDPLLGHSIGKTIVAVWRRDDDFS